MVQLVHEHGGYFHKIGDPVGVRTHGLMLIKADLIITPDKCLNL